MSTTPRMSWTIPAAYEESWERKLTTAFYGADASAFADAENNNTFFYGGGLVSFSAGSDLLSWASTINVITSTSSYLVNITGPSSITLLDNQWLYIIIPRRIYTATTVSFSVATGRINVSGSDIHDHIAIARRIGDNIYFRTGTVLSDGQSATIFETPIPAIFAAHYHVDQVFIATGGETFFTLSHVSPDLIKINFFRGGIRGADTYDYTIDIGTGIVTFSPPGSVAVAGEQFIMEKILSI